MHGLRASSLISGSYHLRTFTFPTFFSSAPTDVEKFLRRQERQRLAELIDGLSVEIEAEKVEREKSEIEDRKTVVFFEKLVALELSFGTSEGEKVEKPRKEEEEVELSPTGVEKVSRVDHMVQLRI